MALQLTQEHSSGVSGNYWHVTHLSLNRETDCLEVRIALYKDAAAYAAGKTELCFLNRAFTSITPATEDLIAFAYTKLKLLPEFVGAVDV